VVQLPAAERGIQITLAARGPVQIQVRLQRRDQIIVRAVVRILPDCLILTFGQLLEPVVLLEVLLRNLEVLRFPGRREVHLSAGNHPHLPEVNAAEQPGQIGAFVEPVVESTQQGKRLGIARMPCIDEAQGYPRTCVAGPI